MRAFFCAGEASGDAYAAALVERIRALESNVIVEGIGGQRFANQAATLVADSSAWGAIGVAQVAKVYFRALKGLKAARRALSIGKPGVFIPIDYGYMNMKLCRHAKAAGWKVVYFSPPGAWRRDRQGADLHALTDAIVTPFSWSADILNAMGGKAYWFGHPTKEMIVRSGAAPTEPRETIAVLPGSRRAEVDLLLPVLAEAFQDELRTLEFAVAPSFEIEEIASKWAAFAPRRSGDRFIKDDVYGVLSRARAGVICSGTATLEAALCGCPHVVVYKISKLTELEARIVGIKKSIFISQPNIFLNRRAVPELIQDDARPDAIRNELHALIEDGDARTTQLAAFSELDEALGPADAISRAAALIVEIAKDSQPIPPK